MNDAKCTKHIRYGIYARTATGGTSEVERQIVASRAAIARRGGGTIVTEQCDINVSGTGALGPGLVGLLREVVGGTVDSVVVTDLDRLSRSSAVLARILSVFERAGASVFTAMEV
jgi:DNA invertase Pin-like site-specific DNA recombinase